MKTSWKLTSTQFEELSDLLISLSQVTIATGRVLRHLCQDPSIFYATEKHNKNLLEIEVSFLFQALLKVCRSGYIDKQVIIGHIITEDDIKRLREETDSISS